MGARQKFCGMGRGCTSPILAYRAGRGEDSRTILAGWQSGRGKIAEKGGACKFPLAFIEGPFVILSYPRLPVDVPLEPQCFVFAGGKFCFHV